MNKETLMIIIVILIAIDVLREGYLKGFVGAFLKNIIRYKKIALIGLVVTIFTIVYLDLPVAKQFSNKYYDKILQGVENGARTATPEEIVVLQKKAEVEKINKEKYSKYERFLANQGDGDTTAANVVILLLLGTLFKNKKLRKVSKEALMTIIAAGLLVNILKYIISRLRPDVNMLPYQFFNWASWIGGNESINPFKSASASLPSGHSIVSVAVAFSFYYGYKNKFIRGLAIVYALALSCSRVYGTRHWLSDIISAGFLGVLVAKTIYEINKEKK
ncbi:MAG: phosphatase PAP2 family protein [Psychrilyobacter sp.]|uniref:phosphatase PAP2 family protein n=1 Tax=Psychrilyobacter sp. TaxID=2586924 RepID=UPI003C739506